MTDFSGNVSSDTSKAIYLKSLGVTEFGEFALGSNTTKILHEDPKLLLFTLARYKFVAKMFSGLNNVLEVGCQEGFGASIVCQNVKHLHGVDFYVPHIESCNRRIKSKKMTFEAFDMLTGPVSGEFQGAFALDVLEHIDSQNEDLFMKNISNSISDSGVVILGMPSLESQKYASVASRLGHVNCKTGDEFNLYARRYFNNVFSFGMNDEVLHTGFFPMSHYLFVLCTNPIRR